MRNRNDELGRSGENKAAEYLDSIGYEILERNYKCRYGEIDIIALYEETLCFIEVKTRLSTRYGYPCEAVNARKREHIVKCAYTYMSMCCCSYRDIRIEIVELLRVKGKFYVRHIRDC